VVDESLQRLFWWKNESPPSPLRVAAQVMVYGSLDDFQRVRKLHGNQIFSEVLDNPPRGVFDAKSWVFWHKKLNRQTIPPLPPQPIAWAP
jgi:hypothetical protein